MIKVLVIFGTRPEAIKMAPVIKEMYKFPENFKVVVGVTAQHREMLDQVLKLFEIKPNFDLNIMQENQTLHYLSSRAMEFVSETLIRLKPDLVLVQGDTTTAMIVALAAFYQRIPVGHIEAGLRTSDIYNPFPEEVNRRLISTLATLNFAPTKTAVISLRSEGIKDAKIFLTGNTIIDALKMVTDKIDDSKVILSLNGRRLILVTAHRRENFGKPLKNICLALKEIVNKNKDVEVIYPVHLNPNVRDIVYKELKNRERINLIDPVEYDELIYLLRNSYFILTDSGGIQEEAPTYGKPVLVMRKVTERPEGVEAGVAKVVGTDTKTIVRKAQTLLNNSEAYNKMSKAVNPYGDGRASQRIVKIIKDYFKNAEDRKQKN